MPRLVILVLGLQLAELLDWVPERSSVTNFKDNNKRNTNNSSR